MGHSGDDAMTSILNVAKLSKNFGGLVALQNIDIKADEGQIVGVIGPNGAGKTTFFNCLTGLYHPTGGQITFDESPIIPQLSAAKKKLIQTSAIFFFFLGVLQVPLFWSYYLPNTYYKVELGLLAIFLLGIRWVVSRGIRQYEIWAWGVVFVYLLADLYFSIWWLTHLSEIGVVGGTTIPLSFFAVPWSVMAIPFSLYFFWHMMKKDGRQLYGFRVGPDQICAMGMARTFQNIRLFLSLSVLDNVKIGAHIRLKASLLATLLRTGGQKKEEADAEQQAMERLSFVGLEHRAFDLAGALAYGEQRRLEIARALASNPKLLLLDEPAAGMNPQESTQLMQLIRKICESGITIVIIEHDMKVMMNLADIIYVLDYGELIAHGTPDAIRENPEVIKAYLGGSMAYAESK